MKMATEKPADIDEWLQAAPQAKPPERLKSLRVECIPERWLRGLNTALVLLMIGVALRIVFLLIWPVPAPRMDQAPAKPDAQAAAPADLKVPSLSAGAWPMFQAQVTQSAQPTPAPLSEPAKSLLTKLNVLGILTGNPSQAVIEDTATHKTYTIGVGQVLLDGIQVQAIEPGRVTVTWQGESVELRI